MADYPAFPFYPGDWQKNAKLRRCTPTQRSAWLDTICLMHDQDEYGVLRWSLAAIAKAVGYKLADMRALASIEVIKGSDEGLLVPFTYTPRTGRRMGQPVILLPVQPGPLWFSSRMVRDNYIRGNRGGWGPSVAAKQPPKPPNGEAFGDTIGAPFGVGIGETFGEPFGAPFGAHQSPHPTRAAPSLSSSISNTGDPIGSPSTREDAREPEGDLKGSQNSPSPGEMCKAMKAAGVSDVNPNNPTLRALLAQGMTEGELVHAAQIAIDAHAKKPFAYALEVAQTAREKAAKVKLAPASEKVTFMETILARGRHAQAMGEIGEVDDGPDDVARD